MFNLHYVATATVALTVGLVSPAAAQALKGTTVLGLGVGRLEYQHKDTFSSFSALVLPSVGTFVSDRVALGVKLPFGYTRRKTNYTYQTIKYSSTELGVLPWLRYYVPTSSKHQVFGELSAGVGFSNTGPRTFGVAAGGVGYTYFVAPAVGLEALLAYEANAGDAYAFGHTALSLQLGIRAYLPKGSSATAPTE